MSQIKKYGFLGFIRLGIYCVYSKLVFGNKVRVIKCIPTLLNPKQICFGVGFTAGKGLRIECVGSDPGEVIFGKGVKVNDYVHIGSLISVRIGHSTLIGSRVTIVDHDHGVYSMNNDRPVSCSDQAPDERLLSGSPVNIGRNVWIGDGAVILSGVNLGDGVVVGANAVVTKSFPAGTIVCGIPAKRIGEY